jgi:hypothetical protein
VNTAVSVIEIQVCNMFNFFYIALLFFTTHHTTTKSPALTASRGIDCVASETN